MLRLSGATNILQSVALNSLRALRAARKHAKRCRGTGKYAREPSATAAEAKAEVLNAEAHVVEAGRVRDPNLLEQDLTTYGIEAHTMPI